MDDARIDRHLFSRQTLRIAGAVPVLVVQLYGRKIGRKATDAFENPPPDYRMFFDQRELGLSQAARLLQNRIGDADLPMSWSRAPMRMRSI